MLLLQLNVKVAIQLFASRYQYYIHVTDNSISAYAAYAATNAIIQSK